MNKKTDSKIITPGPVWIWILASIAFAQLVKRGIIGWPLPTKFNLSSRFIENLLSNIVFSLPVIIIFTVITIVMTKKAKQKP